MAKHPSSHASRKTKSSAKVRASKRTKASGKADAEENSARSSSSTKHQTRGGVQRFRS